MISSLVDPPNAPALDWDAEVKGHLHVDIDDEEARVTNILIPTVTDWVEALTGRQLIDATWVCWWPSFAAACTAAAKLCKYPLDTILIPRPPLQTVTWVKYYDTANVQQTWDSSNYTVTIPEGPKGGKAWLRPIPSALFPNTYARPDAVEIKFEAGYGAAASDVPGGLRQAMLLLLGELFIRREIAVVGTIVNNAPIGAVNLALGYAVDF